MLHELMIVCAGAAAPDAQVDVVIEPRRLVAGARFGESDDALAYIEQDTNDVRVSSVSETFESGTSMTTIVLDVVAGDAHSLVEILDYDGDGIGNLIGSNVGELDHYVDLESGLVVDVEDVCGHSAVGDFTGDGLDDYVTSFAVWKGDSKGLIRGVEFDDSDSEVCNRVFEVGDIDGDGRDDLIRTNWQTVDGWYGQEIEGGMDLFLSKSYAEPTWEPAWSWGNGLHPAGRAVAGADVDGDGAQELVVLSGSDANVAITGEVQILDDLLAAEGPSVVATEALATYASNYRGVEITTLGDMDGDGDDEVLLLLDQYGSIVRIVDAEPVDGDLGLRRDHLKALELPFPGIQSFSHVDVQTGDFDGDETVDIAVSLTWESEDESHLEGSLGFWFGSVLRGGTAPLVEVRDAVAEHREDATPSAACGCAASRVAAGGVVLIAALGGLRARRGVTGMKAW